MRITVLAGAGASTSILLNWLLQQGYDDLDVIVEARQSRFSQLRNRARRQGLLRTFGQAVFMSMLLPFLRKESAVRTRQLIADRGLDDRFPDLPRRLDVSNINEHIVIERLQDRNPSVVLVNGTRIIRGHILSAVTAPYINMHAGITPYYRGVHGGYWAIYNDDVANFGVTLHLVDEGVDTGGILKQVQIKPTSEDNFASYPLLQQTEAFASLKNLLEQVAEGNSISPLAESSEPGRQWSHPTAFEYLRGRFYGVR